MPQSARHWPARKVRDTFLDFFRNKRHQFVPSANVIPHNDPSLLFTNAGMNQYKQIFLGTVNPQSEFAQLKRATNSQKCIRAGGKHNDLDDVGKDSYHHTFFEMLGNWSFGDYFKKEAIEYAWELLTKVFELDPNRLYVTYFEGHKPSGLDPDLEAKSLWLEVGVREDHIVPGNMRDNFWEMGDQGPCGPCIELHYDRIGDGRNARHLVNQDDPNVIEIWNVVFIQFNRETDGALSLLPHKHIDTGMGFERIVSILQDKPSNYDTDCFTPLFQKIQEITQAHPYRGRFGVEDDGVDTAYRVVADHVRTCVVAIADGTMPDSTGRGYVVRRILRRGSRYARKYFNVNIGSFFSKIVPIVVEQLVDIFPEVQDKEQVIKDILDEEERAFASSLDRGEAMFNRFVQTCAEQGSHNFPGDYAWRLYDTYGFPIDLTKLMAEEQGLTFDEQQIITAQEKARLASKGEGKNALASMAFDVHDVAALEKMGVQKTNDSAKYERSKIDARVMAIFHGQNFLETTTELPEGTEVGFLLDQTCLYAESGGQQYDTGRLIVDGVAEINVRNVQSYKGYVLHTGFIEHGSVSVGDKLAVEYDIPRRQSIQMNHSGTHILNFALREVLGDHIEQRGSLVTPDKLRFDFSHRTAISDDQLNLIEKICNDHILADREVFAFDMPLKEAQQIPGIRIAFGESYPDPARVVSIGAPSSSELLLSSAAKGFSIELCGGTHVRRTSEIRDLVVTEEAGIAKGIRRIVAVTGAAASRARGAAREFGEGKLVEFEVVNEKMEKSLRAARAELGMLELGVVAKRNFEARLVEVGKKLLRERKAAHKARVELVVDVVEERLRECDDAAVIVRLPGRNSARVVADAVKHFSSSSSSGIEGGQGRSVYLLSVDDSGEKITHGCYVAPEHAVRGIVAGEWVARVAGEIGGNAGGKGSTGSGSGGDVGLLEVGTATALDFPKKLQII